MSRTVDGGTGALILATTEKVNGAVRPRTSAAVSESFPPSN